ncbi:hypothetical protein NIES25_52190 [Nostoc linckia NIES-25]|nr:hypothetical protein NIES25_52190 [Nostoc linckia NIES-25]
MLVNFLLTYSCNPNSNLFIIFFIVLLIGSIWGLCNDPDMPFFAGIFVIIMLIFFIWLFWYDCYGRNN